MNGILMWNNNLGASSGPGGNTLDGQITEPATLGYATSGKFLNVVVKDPQIARPFEYSDPDFRGTFGSPIFGANWISPPDDGFFDQSANFVGGVGDYDWTEEWTSFLVESDVAP